jgi:glutamate-1-semialdehyde 2,1-aminomutase
LIEASLKKYLERTPKSKKLFEAAVKVAPGGVHHNIRYHQPYPLFFDRAKGNRVWDADGNEYIDFWMGHGAWILGHAPDNIVKAMCSQAGKSPHYGMPSKIQIDLARQVAKMMPGAQKIRFANTGTEATMYAVRFARAFTKKRKIAKFEGNWHGGHDILNVAVRAPLDKPSTAGALEETAKYTIRCPFNDIDGTMKLLDQNADDLAGVIVEPVIMAGGALPADREFLKALREKCSDTGAVLILDEVVTGFRLAKGGAQEIYGVRGDLMTLGKVLGGGCPIGAVAGKDEIMDVCDPSKGRPHEQVAQQGGTFCGNPLTMVAGYTTLKTLDEHPEIYPRINRLAEKAKREVDQTFDRAGIMAQSTGMGSMFMTHFLKQKGAKINSIRAVYEKTDRVKLFEYYFELLNHGIFFLPTHIALVSSVHTEEDVEKLVQATKKAIPLLK